MVYEEEKISNGMIVNAWKICGLGLFQPVKALI